MAHRLKHRRRMFERLEARDLLASVVMQSLSADGGTQLALTYEVLEPTTELNVGIYRNSGATLADAVLLDNATLTNPQDLTVGVHVKNFTIGSGPDQIALPGAGASDVEQDYAIWAVADPTIPSSVNTAVFAGVYHAPLSDVFVHGSSRPDSVVIDSSYRVTLNGMMKRYSSADVTGFRVRSHDGHDAVNASTAAKVVSIYGGSGNDALKGGSVADSLFGGTGDDELVGGRGNDALDGGEGSDVYPIAGTNQGADIYLDRGIVGVDRIVATANSTSITLGASFSAASGIEAIAANGFSRVSLVGTSGINTFDFSALTLTGLSIVDSLAGADAIVGSSGDDLIRPGTGNDNVDGGSGTDVVHFAGTLATYSIVRTGDTVVVKDLATTVNGNDGTDALRGIEVLRFLDGDYNLMGPANSPPLALPDSLTVTEDDAVQTISVLANDLDPDLGDALSIVSVSGPALRGTVAISADGLGIDYRPGNSFQSMSSGQSEVELFTYTIADSAGAQATASVTVTVTGANDQPLAVNDSITVSDASSATIVQVLANDTDVDAGDTKRVVSINSAGVRGIVQIPAGGTGVLFLPNNAYAYLKAGESAIETITYTMSDAAGLQSTATLLVTVTGSNQAPVAMADAATLSENASSTSLDVLVNDTDVDMGDTKTVLSVNGAGYPDGWELVCIYGVCAPVAYPGVPAIRGMLTVAPDGKGVTYSPGNVFQYLRAGQTATERFTYTMADSAGATSTAWVTVSIVGANDAPVAVADNLIVAKNSAPVTVNVLANDTDLDSGDTKRVLSIDTAGLRGSATISVGGTSVIYAVGNNFLDLLPGQVAVDTFTYSMVDAAGALSTTSVVVRVNETNSAPTAVADNGAAIENGVPVTIDVLSNDTDEDAGDTKSVVSVSSVDSVSGVGLQGAVSVAPGGSGIIYAVGNAFQSLALGATATETFTYTMRDSLGAQSTATVQVTVTGVNDSPVAIADSAIASEDGAPITINVLANDSDIDAADSKQIVSVLGTNLQGAVSIAADGTAIVYSVGGAFQSLRAGASATEVFSYTMRDTAGATSTANVTVSITGVNDSPVAIANAFSVTEDSTATTLAVLANDTDPDAGDTKRVVSVNTLGMLGTVTVAAGGTGVIYNAGSVYQHLIAGQTATETFTYTMSDAAGALSTASVTLTITGITDGPKANNDMVFAMEDGGPIVIDVLANDVSDLEPSSSLTITSIDGAGQYASLTLIMIYGVGV
ncbi:MAG: tandem-95 repeat protein, partial [Pirellulaceae bacterium]|nr:tandem-95 repeat protein [Pirellulaceae bacterium]